MVCMWIYTYVYKHTYVYLYIHAEAQVCIVSPVNTCLLCKQKSPDYLHWGAKWSIRASLLRYLSLLGRWASSALVILHIETKQCASV